MHSPVEVMQPLHVAVTQKPAVQVSPTLQVLQVVPFAPQEASVVPPPATQAPVSASTHVAQAGSTQRPETQFCPPLQAVHIVPRPQVFWAIPE